MKIHGRNGTLGVMGETERWKVSLHHAQRERLGSHYSKGKAVSTPSNSFHSLHDHVEKGPYRDEQ